jgi:hypothetical protein
LLPRTVPLASVFIDQMNDVDASSLIALAIIS